MLINTVLLMVLTLLIIVMLLVLWKHGKKIQKKQKAYQEQVKLFLKQCEAVRKEKEELEQYKKEIRDMIGNWKKDLGQSQSPAFEKYQEMLLQDMQAQKNDIVYWKNPVLNMVFCHKLDECDACQIAVTTNGFPAGGISLPVNSISELVGLFANLMDNAIEASIHLPEDARWIRFRANVERKRVLIMLENSCGVISQRTKGEKTWKQNKKDHGIGKDIIHEVVNRNNGWITFAQKDGIHRVEMMLPADCAE